MIKNLIFTVMILLMPLYSFAYEVYADESLKALIINEIFPNPEGSDTGFEWLELYNYSDEVIVAQNLTLEFESLSGSKRSILLDEVSVDPKSFLIVSNQDFLEIEGLVVLATISMYNDGGFVRLTVDGNIIDEITYATSSSSISFERNGYLVLAECNQMLLHPSAHSLGELNINTNSECIETIEEPKIEAQIILSLDGLTWYESIQTTGPVDLFFDINSSNDIDSILFKDYSGGEIFSPLHLDSLWNQKIFADITIDEKIYTIESNPILVANKDFRINEINLSDTLEIEVFKQIDIDPSGFYLNVNDTQTDISSCFTLEYCVVSYTLESQNLNIALNFNESIIESLELRDFSENVSFFEGEWKADFESSIGFENLPPTKILITEVYPSPEAIESEQVEIYNAGEYTAKLSGMYLKDAGSQSDGYGTKTFYLPDLLLAPNEYLVLDTINITLNNSGDTIALFSKKDKILDSVTYPSTASATSCIRYFPYAANETALEISEILTLGYQNPQRFDPFSLSITSINQAKELEDETWVLVEGIVTVEPNVLGEGEFYIQDATGGIRVDLGIAESFKIGDLILVYAQLDTKASEREIDLVDMQYFKIVSRHNSITALGLNDILEENIGRLVKIKGDIIENYSTSFVLTTQSDNLKVSILSSTGIAKLDKSKGDSAEVVGILSVYNGEYRLLPRYSSDIKISKPITPMSLLNTLDSSTAIKSDTQSEASSLKVPATSVVNDASVLGEETQSIQTQIFLWPIWVIFTFVCIMTLLFKLKDSINIKKIIKEYKSFREFTLNKPEKLLKQFNEIR